MKAVFVGGELSGRTLDVADPSPQFHKNLVINDGDMYLELYRRRVFIHTSNPHVVFRIEYEFVRYESYNVRRVWPLCAHGEMTT